MHFDILIIGSVTMDANTDYGCEPVNQIGGAVYYAGYSAAATGANAAVLAKANLTEVDVKKAFAGAGGLTVYPVHSPSTTHVCNIYTTPEREKRISRQPSSAAPFTIDEIPLGLDADIYDLGGLNRGDFSDGFILALSKRGPVALDVQGILRCIENGEAVFRDWETKRDVLPHLRYLKTDANEAEILTGLKDRYAAAEQILDWGCPEVIITYNTEVIAATRDGVWSEPLLARNLSGRTGRGDTTFASYLCQRRLYPVAQALRYAAACVSLKMEAPGPFRGRSKDVLDYINQFYSGKTKGE